MHFLNYARNIIKSWRCFIVKKEQWTVFDYGENLIAEYHKHLDVIKGKNPDIDMTERVDGQISFRMIGDGIHRNGVIYAIAECSTVAREVFAKHGTALREYANNIVTRVEQCMKRIGEISTAINEEFAERVAGFLVDTCFSKKQKESAVTSYNWIMKSIGFTQHKEKDDIWASSIMLDSGWREKDVEYAIKNASPLAINNDYSHYIIEKAKAFNIERAVANYEPEMRSNKEVAAVDEYRYHVYNLTKNTKGILSSYADANIAKVMLKQGYNKNEIARAVAKYSPCAPSLSNQARDYGKGIIKSAQDRLNNEMIKSHEFSR